MIYKGNYKYIFYIFNKQHIYLTKAYIIIIILYYKLIKLK